jgi:hypothetical protein
MAFAFNPITGKLDLVGSGGGGNPFDQSLNTTDSVIFDTVHATGAISASSAIFGDSESPDYVFVQTDGVFGSSGGVPWGVDANKTIAYLQNANSFTAKQTITAAANTSALTATYSVTGANTTPLLDLSGTWNTTGVATGIKLNITDTASASTSRLFDVQVGGTSSFTVFKPSATSNAGGFSFTPGTNTGTFLFDSASTSAVNFKRATTTIFTARADSIATFNFGSAFSVGWNSDTYLARDAANTLALRNGTAAQTFRLYNTYTDASNYERGFMRWNSNVLEIGAEAGGTGTGRVTKILSAAQVDVFTFGAVQAARFSSGSSIIYNSLVFGGATLTANPTTTDLNAGRAGVWKNSTTGVVSLWYNDGGTMKSVVLV